MQKLLLSQKNELFDLCVAANLDPSKVFFEDRKMNSNSRKVDTIFIGYRNSSYFFETNEDEEYYSKADYRFSPSKDDWSTHLSSSEKWDTFKKLCSEWINYLSREVNQPDKWELYKSQSENLKLSNVASTEQFSVGEYEVLKQQMNVLKEGIKELKLPADQLKLVESKLDQVLEQAKTTSKVNWRDMLIGATFSIIVQLSLSQEQGKALWKLVEQAFTTLFLK